MKHLWDTEHDYYCSDENFYVSRRSPPCWGQPQQFDCWEDFDNAFGQSDMGMNLVFRWDWDITAATLKVYIMLQRKGTFLPVEIKNMTEEFEPRVREFLQPRFEYLKQLWEPLK